MGNTRRASSVRSPPTLNPGAGYREEMCYFGSQLAHAPLGARALTELRAVVLRYCSVRERVNRETFVAFFRFGETEKYVSVE